MLSQGWVLNKFYDNAEIISDKITPEEMNGNYQKYIGLDNIERDTGNLINFSETDGAFIKSDKFKFTEDDILYGKLRPYLNKVFLPNFKGICSTDILVIRPIKGKIIREFLAIYMRHPDFVNYANQRTVGANLPRVNPKEILNSEIPVPPIKIQRKIVAIIEQLETTKQLRSQADKLITQLIISVFFKMFGDPILNTGHWEINKLEHLIRDKKDITCGPFGSQLKISEYVDNGVPVLGIENIDKDRFIYASPKYITEKKYLDLLQFSVKSGDVIISRAGTVGRTCIVPDNISKAVIGSNLLKVTLDKDKILPEFFSVALNYMPSLSQEIMNNAPGGSYAFLNTKKLKAIEIITPPIDKQNHFSKIYNECKEISIKSNYYKKEEDNLINCVLSNAFTGELVV
jgi:type I restriction enzyme S subunit